MSFERRMKRERRAPSALSSWQANTRNDCACERHAIPTRIRSLSSLVFLIGTLLQQDWRRRRMDAQGHCMRETGPVLVLAGEHPNSDGDALEFAVVAHHRCINLDQAIFFDSKQAAIVQCMQVSTK